METAFTTKKDYGKGERERLIERWLNEPSTDCNLQKPQNSLVTRTTTGNFSEIAKQAKRHAEVARLRELHTLKGHVESVVKLNSTTLHCLTETKKIGRVLSAKRDG